MTRRIDRKTLCRCWVLGCALLIVFVLVVELGNGGPVAIALSAAPFYALLAYTVATAIAAFTRRPLGRVDLIRITCWTVFAGGLGVRDMAASYYPYFWPQCSASAETVGNSVAGLSLLIIIVVSVLWPAPKRYPAHCCPQCGYNLTGNVSGVCPECGEAV